MQTRMNSPKRALQITPLGRGGVALLLAVTLSVSGLVLAQTDVNLPIESPAVAAAEPVKVAPVAGAPFIAEIVGNDVYVRSGPGTNFYHCGKLYKGDNVQVVKIQQGWSCIVPPPGCFSWISMQYVSINLDNPTMGIVTGDNVGVYAGSDYVFPMNSTSKQVTLNRGQSVKLLSEEKDDYYKVAPPQGAFLWVSSQYAQPVQSDLSSSSTGVELPGQRMPATPEPVVKVETESDLLDQYYALSKAVKAEGVKPMAEQDYAEIKTKLGLIAEQAEGGRAARYAQFTLKQVDRFELACTVAKEVKLQSQERATATEKISEARAARLAQIEDLGRFAVIGTLQETSIYEPTGTAKRYRILDASGKTVCYVAPTGAAVGMDMSKLIGKKVGLVGEIEPHPATARAFVKFSEISALD